MSDMNEFLEMMEFVYIIYQIYRKYKNVYYKKRKRTWVREMNIDRKVNGFFELNFEKMKEVDPDQFWQSTRMTSDTFDALYSMLEEHLTKRSIRTPISAKCRLFLTLLYLSQGVSRQFLAMSFKIGVTTVRNIAIETCDIIWKVLSQIYVSLPNIAEWERIAADFNNIWDLPNCVGAIDGKHINITCPANSGSQYYNYKGTYSIVLLAVCDANYTFTAVDVGAYGSQSDGGVLNFSLFGSILLKGELKLPDNKYLENSETPFPHYFVGDAAFPLRAYLMRPYPGRLLSAQKENFNKRLSRARRTIENTFGILTARWRILRSTMNMSPESAEIIVKAAIVLHNYVKMNDGSYCPPEYVDHFEGECVTEGLWRQEATPLRSCRQLSSNNATRSAFDLRDQLSDYLFKHNI